MDIENNKNLSSCSMRKVTNSSVPSINCNYQSENNNLNPNCQKLMR